MTQGTVELTIKAALSAAAYIAILDRRTKTMAARKAGPWLALLALLSALAYYNIGIAAPRVSELEGRRVGIAELWDRIELGQKHFHGAGYIHHWETFHYVLGAKYFPELGYDSLYTASVLAERESHPRMRPMSEVRDLRTNELVPLAQLEPEMRRVRARFTDERWASFVSDNAYFINRTNRDYMRRIRIDHGYNPTPFWTFVARIFVSDAPVTHPLIEKVTVIDPLLLALMFSMVFWAYGPRIGCITLIIFGLGYPWRFYWVGGAFLRYDWLAATVIAICALRKERYAIAGALFAYGTLVRVFPVLFLFGIGVVAIRALVRKEPRAWIAYFAGGFAVALLLGIWAGSTVGGGFEAWLEFLTNARKHTQTWLTNNVGLQNLLLYGPDTYRRVLVDYSLPESFIHWYEHLTHLRSQIMPLIVIAMGLMLALTAAAAWRSTPSEAAVLGIIPCFTLLLLTCYYWSMLLVMPLRRGEHSAIGPLIVSCVCIAVHGITSGFEVVYGVCSWAFFILFVTWIWPDAKKTLQREPLTAAELGPEADQLNPDMRAAPAA